MNLGQARDEAVKQCRRCHDFKGIDAFSRNKYGKLRSYCRPCDSAYAREWQNANPERHAQNKHASLVRSRRQFNLWKLDGRLDGLYEGYMRAVYGDPCAYCGAPGPSRDADHIFPIPQERIGRRCKASPREWENLTASCHRCNQLKRRQSLLEFLGWSEGWLRST